ncbi:MAG: type IV toxin-antitoxin system AbiEi family antitoxin domain-containing protein [Endomicrobium sp.]|jgi:predicted transcriptional regulator of viral defense system|nr:type IV toxin-antitoxin system AbiEi family antitoxin domain-containing protein [Endomicrobium sp.]
MTNKEKILSLAKNNNGFITNKQVKAMGLTTRYLTDMLKNNIIEKVKAGLYISTDYIPDKFYEILYNTSGVFSHTTALYLYNLVDRIPLNFDVTVSYDYRGSLQNNEEVNLFYVKNKFHDMGITKMKSPQGCIIEVYDMERTICDIIRNEKRIDSELYVSALKNYVKHKNKKLNILIKYAEKFSIRDKVASNIRILL